jgi:hypothetical protein
MLRSVRPSTAKAEYSNAERPEDRVADVLDRFAMVAANVIVAPHRLEVGTEPPEFLDERLDLCRCAGAGGVHPERAQHEPRHAFPSYCAARARGSRKT